jgi:hypothetical protein
MDFVTIQPMQKKQQSLAVLYQRKKYKKAPDKIFYRGLFCQRGNKKRFNYL